MAGRMGHSLGQPVVIQNIDGAAGSIGAGRVARAAPDGYVLCIGHVQTHVTNAATQALPYDVLSDFAPVALVADTPQWIIVRSTLPAKDLNEFVAWMKTGSGTAKCGTVGAGSLPEIMAIYFQRAIGGDFLFVPYRGGGPLMQDLIAGRIDVSFGVAGITLAPVRAGRLKAYAVLARKRWRWAPDVPTLDEQGINGIYASYWHAIWAPAKTPKDIITRINTAVVDTLADPALRQRFADIGQDIWPREQQTPEALRALQKTEIDKWWPIIKAAGLKAG
jgi:tripartite-type tricarboxylate transporter receptor subunit TctC